MKLKDCMNEKKEIGDKLLKILDMENNYFLLNILDRDIDKQKRIEDLVIELNKYYTTNDLACLHQKKNI